MSKLADADRAKTPMILWDGIFLMAGVGCALALWVRRPLSSVVWRERRALWERSCLRAAQVRLLLLGFLSLFLAWTAARRVLEAIGATGTGGDLLVSVAFHAAGLAWITVVLKKANTGWRAFFGWGAERKASAIGWATAFYFAAMPVVLAADAIYQIWLRALQFRVEDQVVTEIFVRETSFWVRGLLVFLSVGPGPLLEEVLFRGLLLPAVARVWGVPKAVALVSLVFALIHAHVPSLMALYLIAVAFAVGYLYSGTLLVPVVMHALFNGVNLARLMLLTNAGGVSP